MATPSYVCIAENKALVSLEKRYRYKKLKPIYQNKQVYRHKHVNTHRPYKNDIYQQRYNCLVY